jgi:hypothetical protein
MRKLRLELEALQVESFRTSREGPWRGTVNGRSELEGAEGEDFVALTDVVPKTLPPARSCDTCHVTCETRCSCPTLPCTTCA